MRDDIMLDNVNEVREDDVDDNNSGHNENAGSFERSADDMEDLLRKSQIPLFPGRPMNRLGTMLMLLNMCSFHGVSNAFVDELFSLLQKDLLPNNNTMPRTRYEACKTIKKHRLSYDTIHACEKGCVHFWKELSNAIECPKCHSGQYVEGSSIVPKKLLRHFPLIPRLKRMYRCSSIAKLMHWHSSEGESIDGMVQSVVDSSAWKHVNEKWPDFAMEPRNVRLCLALDGMNPFADLSSRHSTWPVMTLNYNLPPWLITKNFFVMLSLIIPGKESVRDQNINVYLQPLVEELELFWHEVPAYDVSSPRGMGDFQLWALLLWTIHEYPTYGLISGCATKGYQGCPVCGPNIDSRYSKALQKNVFGGHRCYLPQTTGHTGGPWLGSMANENSENLQIASVLDTQFRRLSHGQGGLRLGHSDDPVRTHGVKRKSALFRLPYWEVCTEIPKVQLILFIDAICNCHFTFALSNMCLENHVKKCDW